MQKGQKVKYFRLCKATLCFHVSRKVAGTTACPRSYCRSHTAGWGFVIIFQGGRLIIATEILSTTGFPGCSVVKSPSANTGDNRLEPWVRKIPWRRKWYPTPILLPGKSHSQRSLVGYSPGGHKRARHNLVTKQEQHVL